MHREVPRTLQPASPNGITPPETIARLPSQEARRRLGAAELCAVMSFCVTISPSEAPQLGTAKKTISPSNCFCICAGRRLGVFVWV